MKGSGMIMVMTNAARSLFHAVKCGQGVMHRPDHEAESPKKFLRAQVWHMAAHGLDEASHHRFEFDAENVFHAGQRFDQSAPKQSHKAAASLGGVGSQFKERPGHDIDDLIHAHRLPAGCLFRLGQCSQSGFIDGAQAPGQNLDIERLFVSEVVVSRGKINTGISGNITQRSPIKPVFCK